MEWVGVVLVGLVAGGVSGRIMRGKGFGCLGNIIVGVLGAMLGGFLLPLLGLQIEGLTGRLVSATVGAILLLFLLGLGSKKR